MNKFINKILLENDEEEDVDSFFKPKNINSREEKLKIEEQKRLDFIKQISDSLRNIHAINMKFKVNKHNEESVYEKLFLNVFRGAYPELISDYYDQVVFVLSIYKTSPIIAYDFYKFTLGIINEKLNAIPNNYLEKFIHKYFPNLKINEIFEA